LPIFIKEMDKKKVNVMLIQQTLNRELKN